MLDVGAVVLTRSPLPKLLTPNAQAIDAAAMDRHFGGSEGLLPLWIAEPYVDLAPGVTSAIQARAGNGWFGYETRPPALAASFWSWMSQRHSWNGAGLATLVSPSVGTSIGVLIEQLTEHGDGVILQPPVFTDFKPLVTSAGRVVVQNSLQSTDEGYRIDLADLENKAAAPSTTALILCNPHNPVGRVWTPTELARKGGLPALKLLAQTRLQLGDWVGAQQVADTIKKIGDKTNLAGQISNAIMVGKKDYNQSIAFLKDTYESTPNNIQPVVALVRTYLLAGKTQEAGNFLDAVIKASPKNINARILRGQVYSFEGKIQQAISSFEKAIKQDEKNTTSYYHLAVAHMRAKEFKKANEVLNKGLTLAPKNFALGMSLAQLYETTNQTDKAIMRTKSYLK